MDKNSNTFDASNKQLNAVKECKELKKCKKDVEVVDLSSNLIVSMKGLDGFNKLRVLNLDHNFLVNLDNMPSFSKLDTISLNYNRLNDLSNVVKHLAKRSPKILHLSLLKNPINPGPENESKYEAFRKTFRKSFKKLLSLDGADFDGSSIVLPGVLSSKSQGLTPILEESKARATNYDPHKALESGGVKRGKSSTLAVTSKGKGKLTYNHKAYKKYNSTRSLADRILKSNSEGNRFIKNDDL
ncbi:unnamed protein product [Moneuplotes crassus]|uniref:Uncharacterized protein n=2 Tax=Euplotes crassus TaxID=5936 RepID=A0AAD1XUG9_EUPCR|nr:unnamed protein product [Moneuplotes crassus]